LSDKETVHVPDAETQIGVALDRLDGELDVIERARESLEQTFAGMKLTPPEERALGGELRQLRELVNKLDQSAVEASRRS
jgi:hypothetical protein